MIKFYHPNEVPLGGICTSCPKNDIYLVTEGWGDLGLSKNGLLKNCLKHAKSFRSYKIVEIIAKDEKDFQTKIIKIGLEL